MRAVTKVKTPKSTPISGQHKKATYTFPPDVLTAIDEHWRFHETLNSHLADSKSEYIADLIRRDSSKKRSGIKSR